MTQEQEAVILADFFSKLWRVTKDHFIAKVADSCKISTEQYSKVRFKNLTECSLGYSSGTKVIYIVVEEKLSPSISRTTAINLKQRLSKEAYTMLCFWFDNYVRARALGLLGIHPSYPEGLPIIIG